MRLGFLIAFCLTFSVNARGQMQDLLRSSWNGLGTNKIQFDTLTSTAYLFDDSTEFNYKVGDRSISLENSKYPDHCHIYAYLIQDDVLLLRNFLANLELKFLRSPSVLELPSIEFDSLEIDVTLGFQFTVRKDSTFLFSYTNGHSSCLGYHSGRLDAASWNSLIADVHESINADMKIFNTCPKETSTMDGFGPEYFLRLYHNGNLQYFSSGSACGHKIPELAKKYFYKAADFPSYPSDAKGQPDSLRRIYLPFEEKDARIKMITGYICREFFDPESQLYYYSFKSDNSTKTLAVFSKEKLPLNMEIGLLKGDQANVNSDIIIREFKRLLFPVKSFVELSNSRIFYRKSVGWFVSREAITMMPPQALKGSRNARKREREFKRWKKTELGQFLIQSYESSLEGIDCD